MIGPPRLAKPTSTSPQNVAFSVQHLRRLARSAGNLQSSEQQEVLEHDNYIAITPYQPEYIYVPVYDPGIIYYRRPYYGPAITFGVGFPIGAWLNLDFHWGYGGGWGGLYYTGWRSEGWGSGCWNCGWIGRSRGRVSFQNNVYVNNRYKREQKRDQSQRKCEQPQSPQFRPQKCRLQQRPGEQQSRQPDDQRQ
ncbi:MAG: hypothetical protein DMG52_03935 [Acidobacteria bacterium]|nr:MAG: hypothetical protein DMG52_03935 [Acidobacteriota bacterium]